MNTAGSYTCQCRLTYSGSGRDGDCVADPAAQAAVLGLFRTYADGDGNLLRSNKQGDGFAFVPFPQTAPGWNPDPTGEALAASRSAAVQGPGQCATVQAQRSVRPRTRSSGAPRCNRPGLLAGAVGRPAAVASPAAPFVRASAPCFSAGYYTSTPRLAASSRRLNMTALECALACQTAGESGGWAALGGLRAVWGWRTEGGCMQTCGRWHVGLGRRKRVGVACHAKPTCAGAVLQGRQLVVYSLEAPVPCAPCPAAGLNHARLTGPTPCRPPQSALPSSTMKPRRAASSTGTSALMRQTWW